MKIKKIHVLIPVIGAIILLLLIFLMLQPLSNAGQTDYSIFTIGNKSFAITYVAENYSTWASGLMNRTVTNSTTMLFVFTQLGIYPFWMYNTYANLDMIWLNGSGDGARIVYIVKNATSCFDRNSCTVYTPTLLANYVIEAKAGFVDRNNVQVGEDVSFR